MQSNRSRLNQDRHPILTHAKKMSLVVALVAILSGCAPVQTANFDDFIDQQPIPKRVEAKTIDNVNFDDDKFVVDPSIVSDLPAKYPSKNQLEPMEVPDSFDGYEFESQPDYQRGNSVTVDPAAFTRSPTINSTTPTAGTSSRMLAPSTLAPASSQSNRLQPTTMPSEFMQANQPPSAAIETPPVASATAPSALGTEQQPTQQPVILVANPKAFAEAKARLDAEKSATEAAAQIADQIVASEEFEVRPLPQPKQEMTATGSRSELNPLMPSEPSEPVIESGDDFQAEIQADFAAEMVASDKPESSNHLEACDNPDCEIHGSNFAEEPSTEAIATTAPTGESTDFEMPQSNDFARENANVAANDFEPAAAAEKKTIVMQEDVVDKTLQNFGFAPIAHADGMFDLPNPESIAEAMKIEVREEQSQFNAQQTKATVTIPSLPPPVLAIPPSPPQPIAWDKQLATTIAALENQINKLSDDNQKTELNSGLTILQTLQVKMSGGDSPFADAGNREYWDYQVDALSELLNKSATRKDTTGPASRAVHHLQQAVTQLRDMANLKVSVMRFCTKVAGYGQYVPEEADEFTAGQQTLIYCELENFIPAVETIDNQTIYRTRLKSRFHVVDSEGEVVQQVEFPVVEDVARNRRRDFYMHLPVTVGSLNPGSYQLYLTIEDLSGNKTATMDSPMRFDVR